MSKITPNGPLQPSRSWQVLTGAPAAVRLNVEPNCCAAYPTGWRKDLGHLVALSPGLTRHIDHLEATPFPPVLLPRPPFASAAVQLAAAAALRWQRRPAGMTSACQAVNLEAKLRSERCGEGDIVSLVHYVAARTYSDSTARYGSAAASTYGSCVATHSKSPQQMYHSSLNLNLAGYLEAMSSSRHQAMTKLTSNCADCCFETAQRATGDVSICNRKVHSAIRWTGRRQASS